MTTPKQIAASLVIALSLLAPVAQSPAWSAPSPAPKAAAASKDSAVINDAITSLESTKKKLLATGSAKSSVKVQNAINNIKKALVELRRNQSPNQH